MTNLSCGRRRLGAVLANNSDHAEGWEAETYHQNLEIKGDYWEASHAYTGSRFAAKVKGLLPRFPAPGSSKLVRVGNGGSSAVADLSGPFPTVPIASPAQRRALV